MLASRVVKKKKIAFQVFSGKSSSLQFLLKLFLLLVKLIVGEVFNHTFIYTLHH